MQSAKCQICRRELKNPESISRGIGPECINKYSQGAASAGSSVERIGALAKIQDSKLQRWLFVAKLAIGRDRIGEAQEFIKAAEKIAAEHNPAVEASQVPPAAPAAPSLPRQHEIRIRKEGEVFIFCPPWKDQYFISDFKKRVHKSFRRWNDRAYRWEVQPVDSETPSFVAGILRRHFAGYRVTIAQ